MPRDDAWNRLETSKPRTAVDKLTMRRTSRNVLPTVLAVIVAFSGCFKGDPQPTESTEAAATNACTPTPTPHVDRSDTDTFRGENAFDYTIGLICDHSGTHPVERARVPGTPMQDAGSTFLGDSLRQNGFQVTFQNFSGAQYETLLQEKKTSSAYGYYSNNNFCKSADAVRLRGLEFTNVIGTGGNVGGPIFLLLAHWDSKRFAQGSKEPVLGANDGAAGVGVLLEFARTLQPDETDMEIRILLTDGEDGFEDCHPLAGSMYAADQLTEDERARLADGRILLLDMVGDSDVKFYKGCGEDTDLADRVWRAARELDVPQFVDSLGCSVVDDHTPFEEEGFQAVDVIATPFPSYWHTTGDTPDKLDADMMGDIGRILGRVLQGLDEGLLTLP